MPVVLQPILPVRFPWILLLSSFLATSCSTGWHDEKTSGAENADSVTVRVELGKRLFFDRRLSRDLSLSCSSCHKPELAFTDTLPKSKGFGGRVFLRNAPSLLNVSQYRNFFADGGAPTLETQALQPIQDDHEMNMPLDQLAYRLAKDGDYEPLFRKAFNRSVDEFGITHALAAYERSLVSQGSIYDAFLQSGDSSLLSGSQRNGLQLFFGKAKCGSCHNGKWLSDLEFYDVKTGSKEDLGRERITLRPADRGKFKTPVLRNLTLTAPYMHDGSIPDLTGVIRYFNRMDRLNLSENEVIELRSFLESLTDTVYRNTPNFARQ